MSTPTPSSEKENDKILGVERTPFIVLTVLFGIAVLLLIMSVIAFAAKKKKGKYGITKSSISDSSKGFRIIAVMAALSLLITPIVLLVILPIIRHEPEPTPHVWGASDN